MLLAEVLNLDKTQSSIRKIDLFLVNLSKTSKDYLIALSYKATILNKIGKANDALKLLFPLVVNFKNYDVDSIVAICNAIIEICLEAKRYDQVEKYIDLKRRYLPVSKKPLYILDLIKYSLAINNRDDAKMYLKKYLEDATNKDERLYACKELSKIYFQEQQYDKYLEYSKELEEYYQNNLVYDDLNELILNKLFIAYIKGNHTKVICDGSVIIKENLPNKMKLQIATLLIKSYLACDDYKRASITESNYEEFLSEDYAKESLDFCKASYDLYTKTKTVISIREYENKINEYEALTKEVKKQRKTKKKSVELEIPNIEIANEEETVEEIHERYLYKDEPVEEEQLPKVEPVIAKINNVVVSENFNKLSKVFDLINQVSLNTNFREIYRLICIEICKAFPIDEIYFLYFKSEYLGIHYKKERAYDKKPTLENLEGTLSYKSMIDGEELFFDSGDVKFNKSVVTKEPFIDEVHLYSAPLSDEIDSIGSITFLSHIPFLNIEMTYESLKLIISAINSRFVLYMNQKQIEKDNQKLFFITSNMSSGIRDLAEGYIHFSDTAVKMLDVIPDISLEDFYLKMKSTELGEYKNIIEKLYTLLSTYLEIEYDFKKNDNYIRIKERFYPVLVDGVIHIYSLIDDITHIKKTQDELLELAYHNPISHLDTELKLSVDLTDNYVNKKMSLAIVLVNELDLYKDLYGYNFKKQLILAVGDALKEEFADEFTNYVYHLDSENYAILLNNVNDKRAVDVRLNKAFRNVSSRLNEINTRVKLTFSAGVYRLGKNTNLVNPTDMITYAYGALDLAKDIDSLNDVICHFDGELDKKRHYRNSLITHISEAIDHGKIGLTYQQIADINKNQVFGYYVKLNLDNIEVSEEVMNTVIEMKGVAKKLEQYLIINFLKEQKLFYEKIKSYLLCFLRVSDASIDESFFSFVEQQRAFLKVKPSSLVIDVLNANNKIIQRLREMGYLISSSNILDVYSNKCDYYFYNYHNNNCDVKEISELCSKHNTILILNGIDEKNDIDFAKSNNISIVYGKFYKKALRMKAILEKMLK